MLIAALLVAACESKSDSMAEGFACPDTPDLAITLADTIDYIEFVAVDGERVYWMARNGVYSVNKDGTDAVKLPLVAPVDANLPSFGAQRNGGIAVDKVHVYFASGAGVYRVPKLGGQVEVVGATAVNGMAGQLVLDASYVYWVDFYYGAVYKATKGWPRASNAMPLATSGGRPWYLALDDTHVYWSNEVDVLRVAKDGSGLTTVLPGAAAGGLAVDATSIYWLTANQGVYRADPDGQNRAAVYEDHSLAFKAFGLTQDATRLYFALGMSFASINKDGSGYAGDPGSAGGTSRAIAVDAEAVYWGLYFSDGMVQKQCAITNGVPADPSADAIEIEMPTEGPPGTIAFAGCPTAAALDDTHAFAVTFPETTEPRNQVLRIPLTGGTPLLLDDNQNVFGLSQIAGPPKLSATHLYWARGTLTPIVGGSPQWRYSIRRLTKAGTTPESFTVASADAISELMVTATDVWWFGHDNLFRQGFSETSPTAIASITSLSFFGEVGKTVFEADTIYFEKSGRLYAVDTDGTDLRLLLDAVYPPGGPSPYGIGGLETDATHIYWTYSGSSNSHDKVMRLAKAGGIAEELSTNMQTLYDLAVDDTNVYWRLYGTEDFFAVPKAGGTRTSLAMGGNASSVYSSVTISQQRVWWTSCSPSAIRSLPL